MTQDDNIRTMDHPPRLPAAYWLLVRLTNRAEPEDGAGREQALGVRFDGQGDTLAVFSFEEEARGFVRDRTAEVEWHPRRATLEELLHMLIWSHSTAGFVALDPLPELFSDGLIHLVSMRMECFVDQLAEEAPPLNA